MCEDINISLRRLASHIRRDTRPRIELPMFSTNHHPGQIIWYDIVPVTALALALLLTFWTYQYSKLLPTGSIEHGVASYQRGRNDIPKHRQWTTVWPAVVRFDRPVI